MEKLKPIHKFNNGRGATLCHKCRIIISNGFTEEIYCNTCLLEETKQLLEDLLRCGDFYTSAIEIDAYVDNPIGGESFEEKIKSLLKRIRKNV